MLLSTSSHAAGYVIFGASGGIGSALARRLVQNQGASVLLCGRDESKLKALQEKIGGGTPFVANVMDAEAAEEAVKKMESEAGSVAGVANCVGSLTLKTLHATSPKEVRSCAAALDQVGQAQCIYQRIDQARCIASSQHTFACHLVAQLCNLPCQDYDSVVFERSSGSIGR